jgi:zinc transport system ATP-binding protein
MQSPILIAHKLGTVLGNTRIFENVTFEVGRGETVAIIGPNGCGKTVLLKTLLGFLPYHGTITWAPGVKIGYVPQKIDADRHLPIAAQNLLDAKAHILKLSHRDVSESTRAVGLAPHILRAPVGHLSGGQFQKILIAFALLGNPNVILFDEPTASLDELSEEHVYDLMHELQDDRGITFILVSHDLSVINRYANKVLCLNKEHTCFGTPEEALTPDVLARLYGAPHKFFHHNIHRGEGTK